MDISIDFVNSTQNFEEWMARAGTEKSKKEEIEGLMRLRIIGDTTGLRVQHERGRFAFAYDTVILVANILGR